MKDASYEAFTAFTTTKRIKLHGFHHMIPTERNGITHWKQISLNRLSNTRLGIGGYVMLMVPNKAETTTYGCHCPGDMIKRMRPVIATPPVSIR